MSSMPPPYASGNANYGAKPPSNLVWGILTTLFCCLPFGIVSIVYAARVDGKWASGDQAGARSDSEDAKKWAIIAAVISLVLIALYFLVVVIVLGSSTGY